MFTHVNTDFLDQRRIQDGLLLVVQFLDAGPVACESGFEYLAIQLDEPGDLILRNTNGSVRRFHSFNVRCDGNGLGAGFLR